jgi:lipoic acid synthetase
VIRERKPEWLKVRAPGGERYSLIKATLRSRDLHTVCEEARCPNVGECWGAGTATFMLLGDVCTRGCRFCAVTTGNPKGAYDPREPEQVADAVAKMGLDYVVLTMVDRDDLLDGGAAHVARTVRTIKAKNSRVLVEALTGDFQGDADSIRTVVESGAEVFAHNVETVRRLTRTVRDVRCDYDATLEVLAWAKAIPGPHVTKSSIMVGLGETHEEVLETMRDLRAVGVDIVTIGQYLRPSEKHHAVVEYVHPDAFADLRSKGVAMGFRFVASGPLVRSSYKAGEVFVQSLFREGHGDLARA